MSNFRDDAPPWSFFIPVTLAVIVGVLAADAIRHAIGTVFGDDEAPRQVEAGPRGEPEPPLQAAPEAAPEPRPRADAGAGASMAAPAPAPDKGSGGHGPHTCSARLVQPCGARGTAHRSGSPVRGTDQRIWQ